MISEEQRDIIIKVLQPLNPRMIGIFGSFARNENNDKSDIDILVDFPKTVNLLDIIGAEFNLSKRLKSKVDIVTKQSVSPRLAPHINKDLQLIFHEG